MQVRLDGLPAFGDGHDVVHVQPHPVRHSLAADLAGVAVPLHHLAAQLGSHELALFLGVVFSQRRLEADGRELCVALHDGVLVDPELFVDRNDRVRRLDVVPLAVARLVALQAVLGVERYVFDGGLI